MIFRCPLGLRSRGAQCVDIDECYEMMPCQNGGKCRNTEPGYRCLCKEGYTGQDCGLKLLPATTITPSTDSLVAFLACILVLISKYPVHFFVWDAFGCDI